MLNFHEFGLREGKGRESLLGFPGDGMVEDHNNTIRRKWKEGGGTGEKGLRRGDIERRREERGVNGELHMEVACSGQDVDRLRSPRRDCAL